jgi:hypothetical protein
MSHAIPTPMSTKSENVMAACRTRSRGVRRKRQATLIETSAANRSIAPKWLNPGVIIVAQPR